MGRSPCCEKVGLKKGPWTPEEDQMLLAYIEQHGHGSWRALPAKAGLQRCGKSCRLRWANYLRPDIKRGKFSLQEEQTIIQLHALLGNRWSAIATHLPKRTDNEIKNYWNTHLKKRLAKMGIDPVTHKPKNDALISSDGQSKNAANLSHIAQWESARLEAEARLVRESKLHSHSFHHHLTSPGYIPSSSSTLTPRPRIVENVPKGWNDGTWLKPSEGNGNGGGSSGGVEVDLESPTSTLTFLENVPPIVNSTNGKNSIPLIEFVSGGGGSGSSEAGIVKEEGEHNHWKCLTNSSHLTENSVSFTSSLHEMTISMDGAWTPESLRTSNNGHVHVGNSVMEEGFTNLLLNDSTDRSFSGDEKDFENDGSGHGGNGTGDYYEDNKNYWSSILNLVNSSLSNSSMF